MGVKQILSTCLLFASAFALPMEDASANIEARSVATSSQIASYSFDELYDLTNTFMTAFMYPNNVKEAKMINSTLFSEDVRGRVDATRDFEGRELNTEYIFGLFANVALDADSFTIIGYPLNFTFTHFTANQNIVAFAAIVYYKLPATGQTIPQEMDFWITYNSEKQVSQYDGTFRYVQWQVDTLVKSLEPSLDVNTTAEVETYLQKKIAASVCQTATTYCKGANKQYTSTAACEKYLTEDVRFGQTYEWGMNTITCRMIHQNMVHLRPDVHCPHIGPSGGGMCDDDRTYVGNVLEKYFTNAPFVPYGKGDSTL